MACTLSPAAVAAAAGLPPAAFKDAEAYLPSNNIAPGHRVPCELLDEAGRKVIMPLTWGLIPSFTKSSEKLDHFKMFNARCESIESLPSFRGLVDRKRCVVLCEGYFEWTGPKGDKQPYFVTRNDGKLLRLAALFDTWQRGETSMTSCTIVTTDSSVSMAALHQRLPVVLDDHDAERWVDVHRFTLRALRADKALRCPLFTACGGAAAQPQKASSIGVTSSSSSIVPSASPSSSSASSSAFATSTSHLIEPFLSQYLTWFPVTRKINSIKYNGADGLTPVTIAKASPSKNIMQMFAAAASSSPSKPPQLRHSGGKRKRSSAADESDGDDCVIIDDDAK